MGKINRIDIVNSPPKANGATYRMAFVHFDYWYSASDSMEVRQGILESFYEKTDFRVGFDGVVVTINTRPVPKTNYNVDQLSDMYHRMREEFTAIVEKQSTEIVELRSEVESLRLSHRKNVEDTSEQIVSLNDALNMENGNIVKMNDVLDTVAISVHEITSQIAWEIIPQIKSYSDKVTGVVREYKAFEKNTSREVNNANLTNLQLNSSIISLEVKMKKMEDEFYADSSTVEQDEREDDRQGEQDDQVDDVNELFLRMEAVEEVIEPFIELMKRKKNREEFLSYMKGSYFTSR